MKVKKLSGKVQDAQQIPTLFDNENITYHPIDLQKWKRKEKGFIIRKKWMIW